MDSVQLHELNWTWRKCPVHKPVIWITNETKTLICAKQNDAVGSSIIIYKELLTQDIHSIVLWYGKLGVMSIWYCWVIVGPITSYIPSISFNVWKPCQYISLKSRYVSCNYVLCVFCCTFHPCSCFQQFSTLRISRMAMLVCLSYKSVRSIQCYFNITSISASSLWTFPIRVSVGQSLIFGIEKPIFT